jgi:Mg-chelatase subunit ChlI
MATLTAKDVQNAGVRPQTPGERLRSEVLRTVESLRARGLEEELVLQALFPRTILPIEVMETLTSALISGGHVILFGPPGSGKTSLAKDVWALFPKKVMVVEGCPVQDDPLSLVDPDYSRAVPPCPFCKTKYAGVSYTDLREFRATDVDPSKVPVREGFLREGHGFARLQGSSEVFPDNLTGTINLHKLEEVGDPTSPLVLEPGKLLQANRGLLIVDEAGKLPVGTQNVLLQALQESTVSPAKSRETFPAAFVAICTSNLTDLDNINEPLSDRLQNVYVGFNREHHKNRAIMDIALSQKQLLAQFPDILIEAGVYLVEEWRRGAGEIYELSEVGSNRTMIDIALRSEAYAAMGGVPAPVVSMADFKKGTLDAMLGHIRARGGDSYAQDEKTVQDFLKKQFGEVLHKAGLEYWCTFFAGTLKRDRSEAKRIMDECAQAIKAPSQDRSRSARFARFAEYAAKREKVRGKPGAPDIALTAFFLLSELDVFECTEEK